MTGTVKTAAETAERLGLTITTLKRWSREGRIEAHRQDPWMFEEAEVERFAGVLIAEFEERLAHLRRETVEAA